MPLSRPVDRLLLKAVRGRFSPAVRFGAVTAAVLLVAVVRQYFVTDLLPYLFFIPVIIVSSLVCGMKAGLWAILLATLCAGISFSATSNPFMLSPTQWVAQILFVLVNGLLVVLIAELRRALTSLDNLVRERQQTLERLAGEVAHRTRLATIVEQSRDFIGWAGLNGNVQFVNEAGRSLVGLSAEPRETRIIDFFADEGRGRIDSEIIPAVIESGSWTGEMNFRNFETGEAIPVRYNIFPMTDVDGQTIGYGTVTADLRAAKAAEAQRETLTRELAHRMKNTLAMVQAIMAQTLRSAASMDEARDAIAHRLTALSRAQDILTQTSWARADILDVVNSAIAPHQGGEDRIVASGPHLDLTAQQALGLSLAIHELATNAAKYGALSNDKGRVTLHWSQEQSVFRFDWIEKDGPLVGKPLSKGFGSKLIERIVASYFAGTGRIDFRPEGIHFKLEGEIAPI